MCALCRRDDSVNCVNVEIALNGAVDAGSEILCRVNGKNSETGLS